MEASESLSEPASKPASALARARRFLLLLAYALALLRDALGNSLRRRFPPSEGLLLAAAEAGCSACEATGVRRVARAECCALAGISAFDGGSLRLFDRVPGILKSMPGGTSLEGDSQRANFWRVSSA